MDGKVSLRISRYQKMAMERELAQQELDRTRVELRQVTRERDELEAKLSMLLDHVTGGRFAKSTYSIAEMKSFADDYQQSECEMCEELDALRLENAAKEQTIEAAAKLLELRTRERDAAVEDMKHRIYGCEKCKHYIRKLCELPIEMRKHSFNCWEWRGVQEVAEDA